MRGPRSVARSLRSAPEGRSHACGRTRAHCPGSRSRGSLVTPERWPLIAVQAPGAARPAVGSPISGLAFRADALNDRPRSPRDGHRREGQPNEKSIGTARVASKDGPAGNSAMCPWYQAAGDRSLAGSPTPSPRSCRDPMSRTIPRILLGGRGVAVATEIAGWLRHEIDSVCGVSSAVNVIWRCPKHSCAAHPRRRTQEPS
jgi:hypothetical protein